MEETHASDPSNARLRHLKTDVHSAFIGTIHSFCTRILQQYPVESGVDAEFTVLDTNEQNLLIDEAIEGEFLAALTPDAPRYAQWRNLFLQLGRDGASTIVRSLIRKREMCGALEKFYGRTDEEIIENWNSLITTEKQSLIDAFPAAECENILASRKQSETILNTKQLLSRFTGTNDHDVRFEALSRLLEKFVTQKGTLNTHIIGRGNNELYKELERTLAEIKERAEIYSPPRTAVERIADMRILLEQTRLIWELARNVNGRYDQKKGRAGALDFDDLQLKTVQLLCDERDVRRELQRQYRYIMVDEFQDTNRLQAELIGQLTEHHTVGNLFIVGDAKQSI